jgi:hypothetical protein
MAQHQNRSPLKPHKSENKTSKSNSAASMSINDLSPQLYLRELTGDYLLFASVLQAYLAANPNDRLKKPWVK